MINSSEILLFIGDSRKVLEKYPEIVEKSHILVTSPPYNFGREYDVFKDEMPDTEYNDFLYTIFKRVYDLANPEYRVVVVIKDNYAKFVFNSCEFYNLMKSIGWKPYSYFVLKSGHISKGPSWGSWLSASSPRIRCIHEVCWVFYKENYRKSRKEREIEHDDFINLTKSVYWEDSLFTAEVKKNVHPAQYSPHLVTKFLKLFSFKGETVLDLFNGVGNTGIAALSLGRNYIGVDISEKYIKMSSSEFINRGFSNVKIISEVSI